MKRVDLAPLLLKAPSSGNNMKHISLFEALKKDEEGEVLTEDQVRQGQGKIGDRVQILNDQIGKITFIGYLGEKAIPNWKFVPGNYALVLMDGGSFWSIRLDDQS